MATILNSLDHVRRARVSATEVQKSICATKQAIERSQSLLAAVMDPWPASPASIRQRFWADNRLERG